MAPPAKRVPYLTTDLTDWLKRSEDHPLIKNCVFHYELAFIHPFMDGNGRMGRLWQTPMLGQWNPLFFLLPDKNADSTVFIQFMLEIIETTLSTNLSL